MIGLFTATLALSLAYRLVACRRDKAKLDLQLATANLELSEKEQHYRLLLRLNEELESELEEHKRNQPADIISIQQRRHAEVREMQIRLSDRMTSLGSLLSGIAHDLNNPLSYLSANLEVLREEIEDLHLDKPIETELLDILDESFEGATRVSKTVAELQRFSHPPPSAGGASIEQVTGSAKAIVGSTLQCHAKFDIHLADNFCLVQGADQLTHVLVNLLLNANESILRRGRPRAQNRIDLHVSLHPATQELLIEVTDTGIKLSDTELKTLFDPFRSASSDSQLPSLGLPICHSMIVAMGGRLEAKRASDGTKFMVVLPSELVLLNNVIPLSSAR